MDSWSCSLHEVVSKASRSTLECFDTRAVAVGSHLAIPAVSGGRDVEDGEEGQFFGLRSNTPQLDAHWTALLALCMQHQLQEASFTATNHAGYGTRKEYGGVPLDGVLGALKLTLYMAPRRFPARDQGWTDQVCHCCSIGKECLVVCHFDHMVSLSAEVGSEIQHGRFRCWKWASQRIRLGSSELCPLCFCVHYYRI
jgi:hypothetical protein